MSPSSDVISSVSSTMSNTMRRKNEELQNDLDCISGILKDSCTNGVTTQTISKLSNHVVRSLGIFDYFALTLLSGTIY